jgi:filamentous hemagglutinin
MHRSLHSAAKPATERTPGTPPGVASRFGFAGGLIAVCVAAASAVGAPPPLPTPCLASSCGSSATSFVRYGSASATLSGTTLNITQTTNKAILDWANFSISAGYTVNFIQPGATAAVLNNIWSASPSLIAGNLNANGQVYLYNQNGIVFSKGAQVNVAGLTASTLPFAPVAASSDPYALFENGILSGNTAGQAPPAAFVAPPSGVAGAIQVNSGATLTAADGGRIMLLGSAVTNSGAIATPDGQTILAAASNAVYLMASSNPSMRGLLIAVDGGGTTGAVINNGTITAARGNVTLAGLLVNQSGMVSATTSVGENGSIYLEAGDTASASAAFIPNPTNPAGQQTAFGALSPSNGGTLLLTPGSVTEAMPDGTDTATLTVAEQQAFIPSEVDLAGKLVAMEGNASIVAPGGNVNVYAAGNPNQLVAGLRTPVADRGSIYIDHGASIDVAGLAEVPVAATQNIIQVTLETNDLQNDPQLRSGFLHGAMVTVDINNPPALFDVTPYADNIGAGIDQVLSKAGSIELNATGQAVVRSGSTLNVSGGSIAYQGGYGPNTSEIVASNGQVYNISNAPADLQYVGFANSYAYTDPTWGTSTKGSGQTYYPSYLQGSSAGTLEVAAPQVYLGGTMLAQVVNGPYQRLPATRALGGSLIVGCANCSSGPYANYEVDGGIVFSDTLAPDELISTEVIDGQVVAAGPLPTVTALSPGDLAHNGFNSISVYSNGPVSLPSGTTLALPADGAFTAKSTQSIVIGGSIEAAGADVTLQTVSSTEIEPNDVTLGPGAVIDVGGSWTNDSPRLTLQPGTGPIVLAGGQVSLQAAGDVQLGAGSLINVSGGGWINSNNQLSTGAAGSLSLAASFTLNASDLAENPYIGTISIAPGATLLGGSLKAGAGGTLSLQAGSVTIGTSLQNTPGELLLNPAFFSAGGFAQYDIVGQQDVIIGNPHDLNGSDALTIAPIEQTLAFTGNAQLQPTGTSLSQFTKLQTLPVAFRSPASLDFEATADVSGLTYVGTVTLAQDATIRTDPGASVELNANGYQGAVSVMGAIIAPAGDITLQLLNPTSSVQGGGDTGFISGQSIELGPHALLATPAFADINTFDVQGYRQGQVLAGGSVTLSANKGFIQTDPGSSIDVDGAAGVLDLPNASGRIEPTVVAGNAGSITLAAREGLVLQGALSAQPASYQGRPIQGASGGSLTIGLGEKFNDSGFSGVTSQNSFVGIIYPTDIRTLTLVGSGATGAPALPSSTQLQSGTALIDVGLIDAGGFSNVTLRSGDRIAFAGNVSLATQASLTLDAPLLLADDAAHVSLQSAYVALGNYFNSSDYFDSSFVNPNVPSILSPQGGTGTLSVQAQLIDVRGVSAWSGFGLASLNSSGDIRFVDGQNPYTALPAVNVQGDAGFEGALNTAANLNLKAAQLYPTTDTAFALSALPATGAAMPTVVTISSTAAAPAVPLSAGGNLSVNATEIDQGGIVRAPMGQIQFDAVPLLDDAGNVIDAGSVTLAGGSVTSVSADGLLLPFGQTANGTSWTYSPASGYIDVLSAPPAKQISLNGANVNIASGAKLDLSGGGDLYAYEFIAGEGGSVDVLNQSSLSSTSGRAANTPVYSYAIVPALGSQFSPIDPQYAQNSSVAPNQTIYLSGVPGLPAGTYALLPAHYALLPGAYAIQIVAQNSDLAAGSAVQQPGGAYIVAGQLGVAGTSILSSVTSTVLVAPSTTVRTQSQYTDSYANSFFSAAAIASGVVAPSLPADAGQLALSAVNSLNLNGALNFATGSFVSGTTASGGNVTQQGLGGDVAIVAQNILVADPGAQTGAPADTVVLNVQQLDKLDSQSLLIGATRSQTVAGEQLTVGNVQTVELKNSAALTAPEIIVAAQNQITVDAGAQISATSASGPTASAPSALLLPGGGALLRVSNGGGAPLTVDPSSLPPTPTGTVAIGAGANVTGSGSVLLYGTLNTALAPGAQIDAPAVALYSSQINLGAVPTSTPGLTLTSSLLGSLQGLQQLTLGSSSTIDFYGSVQLGVPGSGNTALRNITLDAAGLLGFGAGNKTLQAGSITFINSSGASGQAIPADGTGTLALIANASAGGGQIELAAGDKTVAGFSAVTLQAAGDIVGAGTGSLNVTGAAVPLTLTATSLIGTAGATQSLSTTGAVTISAAAPNSALTLPTAGLGAAFSIQGSSIAQNGSINLPAGILSLTATNGNVVLGSGSLTSTAGASESFEVTAAAAPGGQITLSSQTGDVIVAAGATLNVAGASSSSGPGSAAGSLDVSAPLGTFTAAGTLEGSAASGQAAGNFSLDVSTLGAGGFGPLDTVLASGGFAGNLALRTRTDTAVDIDSNVQAASFTLTADQGSIEVGASGGVNTSGNSSNTDGGAIALWAGTGLTLDGGAKLLANAGAPGPTGANGSALNSTGGNITLGTSSGLINIQGIGPANATVIAMRGDGDASTDGTLTLRAPRTADDLNVQIQISNGAALALSSRQPVIVEGTKSYAATLLAGSDTGCGTGGSCDVADLNGVLYTDASTFAGNAAAISAGLGLASVQVRPGIEIDSTGDLVLSPGTGAWDLASWALGLGTPVNLTLRAAGNLVFEASLTDGFTNNAAASVSGWAFGEPGTQSSSASYRLTAGADLSSSNPLAVIAQPALNASLAAPPNSGNVILTPGSLIRTGTGNIDIAAGGDLLLGYGVGDAAGNLYDDGVLQVAESDPLTSVIYTAGMPSVLTPAQAALFSPSTGNRANRIAAAYATQGGNITISADDDIRSAMTGQLVSDWLWRRGPGGGAFGPDVNTSWWIMFKYFEQGIGALGGGSLSLSAGRDIVNTSAVIPTTGRLLVAQGGTPVASDLLLTGGGNLSVRAGGDIVSGVYEDDWGNASLVAGGTLTSSTDSTFGQAASGYNLSNAQSVLPPASTEIFPIFVVGNGTFSADTRGDLSLEAVANSTTLPLTLAAQQLGFGSAFYPYALTNNQSSLELLSVGGNVFLDKASLSTVPSIALSNARIGYELSPFPDNYLSFFPATVDVVALSGNIDLGDPSLAKVQPNAVSIQLYPAANGALSLLAQGSINNDGSPYTISESEADPTLMPSAINPADLSTLPGLGTLPQQPLYQANSQPVMVVAQSGNLGSGSLTFPRAADVIAGGDIADVTYVGKNLNPSDVTLIAAGGNITYSTPTQPVTNQLLSNSEGITLAGPGYLEVLAGGTVDLGDSSGIITSGSLSDSRLPTTGAGLVAGAGFGTQAGGGLRQPAYQAFINSYLAPSPNGTPGAYAADLVSYMQQLNPVADANATYGTALSAFDALPRAQQLPLIARVLSDELSATGLAHTLQGTSYARGYAAINTLFPAQDASGQTLAYNGDLNMFFSQIKTEQGGDIDLLVPGGSVDVGVPNPPASLSTVKSYFTATGLVVPADVNLGVLVLGQGAVEGFANDSFEVNQSRILTLEGGDIILWASNGGIDAGKGAKSASGAPPPVIETDASGNLFVDPSNAVSGSGIGQLLTVPGIKAGLVNLIAPKGVVNAGDAGIRVAGNLNIAAVEVIGASNIQVAGTATGVPTSEAGAFAGALSGANSLTDASKSVLSDLNQDLNSATNYQQLSDSLQPTFITVKLFCLGIECETN